MSARALPAERGFSLVELMVTLVIALLLLAGILQILLSNRQSYGVQQSMAGLQQDARLVSFVIENVVAHAGYRVNLYAPDERLFPAHGDAGDDLAIAGGAFIAASHGAGRDSDDSVRLRFQAAGGVHDCAGSEIDGYPGGRSPNQKPRPASADFALVLDKSDPNDMTLDCVIYEDNDRPTGGSSNGEIKYERSLVDNVDRFKISYGIDTNNNRSVDRYVSTLTPANQGHVLSLRLQLLLHSDANVAPTAVAHTYRFLDGTSHTYNDRRARLLLDQTVALRNVLP
ncbi:PilW family protein [Salinisphaera sp.]|uniref:PilW family protein n=1 Tax=Salinisphaera sp. TaxID=1914330 RepID=UPI002D79DFAA|nr:PilW family protein [Salinisphaera sp.]HET7314740.1 PilW family protein [Salinisphaera sp.]